jgi:hypothetical protein
MVTLIPTPPATLDYSTLIPRWPMYANDAIGDCTCAAAGHMVELWTKMGWQEQVPSDSQIVQMYSAVSGYDPTTGAGDNGAVILDVLRYWQRHGLDNQRPYAYVHVTPTNHQEMQCANWLFGGLDIGIQLPLSAADQYNNHQDWDVTDSSLQGDAAPGSWGGHSVNTVGYDQAGLTIVTWGGTWRMTWAFVDAYVDECWALLPAYWATYHPSSIGFKWNQLHADLAALR